MTLRRSGIVKTERFKMDGPSHTLRVPISELHIPNVYVQVDLVGAAQRTDDEGKPNERLPKRPAFAMGSLNLPVPPLARKLSVEATPRDKAIEPGGETWLMSKCAMPEASRLREASLQWSSLMKRYWV